MPAKLLSTKRFSASAKTPRIDGHDVAEPERARNLSKITPPTPYRVHLNRRLFARLDTAPAKPVA